MSWLKLLAGLRILCLTVYFLSHQPSKFCFNCTAREKATVFILAT